MLNNYNENFRQNAKCRIHEENLEQMRESSEKFTIINISETVIDKETRFRFSDSARLNLGVHRVSVRSDHF